MRGSTNNSFDLLILDYGGVYSFDYEPGNYEYIMRTVFGRAPNEAEQELISVESHLLASNKITTDEYVKRVAAILNLPEAPEPSFFEDTNISVTNPPTDDMKSLVTSLRQKEIKVALLSDMYMFEVIKTKPMGRYEGFDHVILSAEIGFTKKDKEIFMAMLETFNCAPNRALFIDDTKRNTETARAVGLHTLWVNKEEYTNAKILSQKIEALVGA